MTTPHGTGPMGDGSPLGAGAAGADVSTEGFAVLGNETRLGILLALWEAKVPGEPLAGNPLSFSALRERVGMTDSGGFNYHLDRLVGRYVDRTEDGYVLRHTGEQLVRALLAGSLSADASFHDVAVDDDCPNCGAGILVDYEDELLVVRCSSCEGNYQFADYPPGVLTANHLPPVALRNRTPEEVYGMAWGWVVGQWRSMLEGVCPACSGAVSATVVPCEDHREGEGDGEVCDRCGSNFEFRVLRVCSVCKNDMWSPAHSAVLADPDVVAFLYDHGIDPFHDRDDGKAEAVRDVRLVSADPLCILVDIAADGDELAVTLDADGDVLEVVEGS